MTLIVIICRMHRLKISSHDTKIHGTKRHIFDIFATTLMSELCRTPMGAGRKFDGVQIRKFAANNEVFRLT